MQILLAKHLAWTDKGFNKQPVMQMITKMKNCILLTNLNPICITLLRKTGLCICQDSTDASILLFL